MTDALGQVTKYSYDAGNRLLSVDRAGTAFDETLVYDTCTNGTGLVCSMTTGAGDAVVFAYDGFGHVASVTTFNNTVAYQYDAQDHITLVTYPSGRTVGYTYNSGGQVINVAVNESGNITNLASNITHTNRSGCDGLDVWQRPRAFAAL
jgi:YD repeat-containing protein